MPPFFIPIAAFLVWAAVLFAYFPTLKLNLILADQLVAPQFFISYLILILAWALSGPITAAVLSVLSAVLVLYICLAVQEPSIFLQVVAYAALFLFMASLLHQVQRKMNDRQLVREKLSEDIHLTRQEQVKKEQLDRALENKIERFLDLHRFAETLKVAQDVHDTAQKIVNEMPLVFPKADECVLYRVDETRQELALVASSRRPGNPVREKRGSLYDQWVMKRSRAIVIEDAYNDFRFPLERRSENDHLRSVCASPLVTENKVLGVARMSGSQGALFAQDDLRLLDIISSLGAVTLRNHLLYERMEELAIRDSLTNLYLNRYFQERLSEELVRAHAHKKAPFSLILLDIDHFKRYNDEFGHAAGDLVLKRSAAILSKSVARSDLTARYGGEEFVVLLPGKDLNEAVKTAETMREAVAAHKFMLRRVESSMTASFGVASYPKDGETKEELIRAVDKRLYEAKRAGRDRVCGGI